MTLRVARYLRVSRSDQGPRLQDDETKDFVSRRGWDLFDTYTDHGISGSKDRRPELDRLLADAKRKRFDVLLVWRSDRMFRSLKHMVNNVAFNRHGSVSAAANRGVHSLGVATPEPSALLGSQWARGSPRRSGSLGHRRCS
jgi:hypothetical protein